MVFVPTGMGGVRVTRRGPLCPPKRCPECLREPCGHKHSQATCDAYKLAAKLSAAKLTPHVGRRLVRLRLYTEHATGFDGEIQRWTYLTLRNLADDATSSDSYLAEYYDVLKPKEPIQ